MRKTLAQSCTFLWERETICLGLVSQREKLKTNLKAFLASGYKLDTPTHGCKQSRGAFRFWGWVNLPVQLDQKLFRNGNGCTEQVHRWIIWSCYQFCAVSNKFRKTWMLLCWITWPFPFRDSQHMDISCPIWSILTHCMLNEKKHGVSDLYQMRTFLQGKAFGPHVLFGHFASLQLTEEPKSHLKMMHSRTTSYKEMQCRDDKTSLPKLQFRNVWIPGQTSELQPGQQDATELTCSAPSWGTARARCPNSSHCWK